MMARDDKTRLDLECHQMTRSKQIKIDHDAKMKLQRAIQVETTDGNILSNIHPHSQNIPPTAQITIENSCEHHSLSEQPNFVRIFQNVRTQFRYLSKIQFKLGFGDELTLVKMMLLHVVTIDRKSSPESEVISQPLLQLVFEPLRDPYSRRRLSSPPHHPSRPPGIRPRSAWPTRQISFLEKTKIAKQSIVITETVKKEKEGGEKGG